MNTDNMRYPEDNRGDTDNVIKAINGARIKLCELEVVVHEFNESLRELLASLLDVEIKDGD